MNKITLMGRLTRDPETRNIPGGDNNIVTSFSLAVDRKFVKQGEERQADFFNVSAFFRTAEFCQKYFTKGQQVIVMGRVENRTWEDDKGKHYSTGVIAEEVFFTGSKKDNEMSNGNFPNPFGETAPGSMGSGNSDFQEAPKNDLPF